MLQYNQGYGYNRSFNNAFRGGFSGASFTPRNSRAGYKQYSGWNRQYGGGRTGKKRSGCTSGIQQGGAKNKGLQYVRGWKYSRTSGMLTFFAAPYYGTKERVSKTGKVWYNWVVKVFSERTKQTQVYTCLANADGSKVIIEALGYVMNPKGGPGGYVGTFITRKQR